MESGEITKQRPVIFDDLVLPFATLWQHQERGAYQFTNRFVLHVLSYDRLLVEICVFRFRKVPHTGTVVQYYMWQPNLTARLLRSCPWSFWLHPGLLQEILVAEHLGKLLPLLPLAHMLSWAKHRPSVPWHIILNEHCVAVLFFYFLFW